MCVCSLIFSTYRIMLSVHTTFLKEAQTFDILNDQREEGIMLTLITP